MCWVALRNDKINIYVFAKEAARRNNVRILKIITEYKRLPPVQAFRFVDFASIETLTLLYENRVLDKNILRHVDNLSTFNRVGRLLISLGEIPTGDNLDMFVKERDNEMITFIPKEKAPTTQDLLTYAIETQNINYADACYGSLSTSMITSLSDVRSRRAPLGSGIDSLGTLSSTIGRSWQILLLS